MKEMALAGRPEPYGQMPSSGKPESGWIAIGSLAAQRAPGLMCGALLNKKNSDHLIIKKGKWIQNDFF